MHLLRDAGAAERIPLVRLPFSWRTRDPVSLVQRGGVSPCVIAPASCLLSVHGTRDARGARASGVVAACAYTRELTSQEESLAGAGSGGTGSPLESILCGSEDHSGMATGRGSGRETEPRSGRRVQSGHRFGSAPADVVTPPGRQREGQTAEAVLLAEHRRGVAQSSSLQQRNPARPPELRETSVTRPRWVLGLTCRHLGAPASTYQRGCGGVRGASRRLDARCSRSRGRGGACRHDRSGAVAWHYRCHTDLP